jgi:hypothetical protein
MFSRQYYQYILPLIATLAVSSSDSVIIFSEGVDYNILTPIVATNLSNVAIQVQGNLHLPQNVTYIQNIVNASNALTYSTSLYWFTFSGPSIDYIGTDSVTDGWIDSYGQAWWDANPVNGTGTPNRPHLISFNTTDGSMQHFKSRKPIGWNVQLTGSNITVSDTIIDAYSTSGSFPFNTDGFDVTATNVKITNSVIFNGDDAIAVQSGSHNVLFQGGTIGYQTHGMSIGSLGQDQTQFANVSNIHFDDITVITEYTHLDSSLGSVAKASHRISPGPISAPTMSLSLSSSLKHTSIRDLLKPNSRMEQ